MYHGGKDEEWQEKRGSESWKRQLKRYALWITAIILILSGIVGCSKGFYFNDHEVVATVTGKERVMDKKNSKYLIYTETSQGDTLVLENTDNILRLKFDSSDLYAQIETGKTYKFTLIGARVGLLSWYENVIHLDAVNG